MEGEKIRLIFYIEVIQTLCMEQERNFPICIPTKEGEI